jgi:hypothetical protein
MHRVGREEEAVAASAPPAAAAMKVLRVVGIIAGVL